MFELKLILAAMVYAFVFGALARAFLPGPDPMPVWLTTAIGFGGTLIGSAIVFAIEGRHARSTTWFGIASILSAVGLLLLYRRFVQKRPLWGKDMHRFPDRGFGVEHQRERLRKVGIDPDQIGRGQPFGAPLPGVAVPRPGAPTHDDPGDPTENPAHYLGLLEVLHDSGVLDDTEYNDARTRLIEKLR